MELKYFKRNHKRPKAIEEMKDLPRPTLREHFPRQSS